MKEGNEERQEKNGSREKGIKNIEIKKIKRLLESKTKKEGKWKATLK